jgi:hypothetical protein
MAKEPTPTERKAMVHVAKEVAKTMLANSPLNVTGRDRHVVVKALSYAIAAIEALPSRQQEFGDKEDMKRLLEHMVGGDAELAQLQRSARAHLTGDGLFRD